MIKNIYLSLCLLISISGFAQQVTITPAVFNVTDEITITVAFSGTVCNSMGLNPTKVYMHAGIGNDANAFGYSVVGNWAADDSVGLMVNNGNGVWSKTIVPSTYFGLTATQQTTASKLGMVFRNATGTQTLKRPTTCDDFIFNVGSFQSTLLTPGVNSTTILSSGGNLNITASNTNGPANYELKSNDIVISTATNVTSFAFNHTGLTENQNYELTITQGTSVQSRRFSAVVNPGIISAVMPANVFEGINYDPNDATKATLVLDAPLKDFVYVAGSFNNWAPGTAYAMKKDSAPNSTKYFLELSNLTPGTDYTYQYWVFETTPIAGSPVLVKTADPYSTLVLSPQDDPSIPASNFPNMPVFPAGQEREVTVLKTGQTPYNWQNDGFVKPAKEDLVVYELLVRDFDSNRTYQNLIDRIDYFKNLKINAIELMPVMEYEGNESWGYNTSFHMALDKFYGPENKLKEFIDLCHQNGIAVILDLALNHAFDRNPFNRMWMNDPDGDGWGGPSSESPYFNMIATHSYSVGNDFNHQQSRTKTYVKRVVKHWIEDFHVDGFRWDLTKGFTQNCTNSESCTNGYQQDRVDVLKEYVDYTWNLDPYHYAIFEHLGADNEEQQWANYRLDETPSKGVMMWGEMFTPYKQLALGYTGDITRMGNVAHGFAAKRLIGFSESHDKDRIMYEMKTYGNQAGTASPYQNLGNALTRMSAVAATSILIPGPKMIWHFAELGMDDSIYTCENGTVNNETDAISGDCKLATKDQPQWSENWLADTQRAKVLSDYTRFITLKTTQPVFKGNYSISPNVTSQKQRIYIFDDAIPVTELRNVVVLANFSTSANDIVPDFPYTGTWYDLMDNSEILITSTNAPINFQPGAFKVYGNRPATLKTEEFGSATAINLSPNPAASYFTINANTAKVEIFSITGQSVKVFSAMHSDYQYNISDLSKGLYLVKATDSENRVKTMKLVKQ